MAASSALSVLALPELVALVLAALLHGGGGAELATQVARALCLCCKDACSAVLASVERVRAPAAWAEAWAQRRQGLRAMPVLSSLALNGAARLCELPPLLGLTRLSCSPDAGAAAAAAWPNLGGLQELVLRGAARIPPAVRGLPHLNRLVAHWRGYPPSWAS